LPRDLLDDRQVIVAGRRAVIAPSGRMVAGAEHEHTKVHLAPLRRHGPAPVRGGRRASPLANTVPLTPFDRAGGFWQHLETMAERSPDVVIVGGGIVGMTAAYYLAKAGVSSVVVERDAIGSHASGFAYGGLSPLSGFGIPGPMAEIAQDGMRLHRELAKSLAE